ncbi:MAG: RagB/SusD family nutrient uptake outer membrane protein, partial [Muribaculaceae bacterium]|nr:RagB/SusD family nutrient uptake outer membrane protein [Muribaculaceae bacterium]
INYLYQNYNGYGNGTGRNGTFYFESLSDDQVGKWGSDVSFNTWPSNVTPGTSSVWNATYTVLRTCNQIIAGVEASSLANSVKGHYIGQAKLNRAWQYYDLVRHYGDVPLVLVPLNVDSPELYGARTNRNTVMDQVLEDLDYAIANITTKAAKTEFSVDLAWAMKAEICLFEASFAKYHQKDNTRANKFYNEVIKAYDALNGSYERFETYGMIYNSTLKAADGIPSLTANKEVIFMKPYAMGTFCNSISKYTSTNSYTLGMSKDAFDSYLFTDGKPLASTTCNKTDVGVITTTDEGSEHLNIENLLEVRDARLAATIDPYIVYTGYTWSRPNSDGLQSTSGYGVRKFTNPNLPKYYNTTDNQGYLCAPLYWMAEIYLAYAEAKAELGTLTDTDLDNTLNKLWARANIPAQTVASLNAIADPANNMGVSSLIYEIRRCRRAELMMD